MISQRPAEADDRAVPGHWEGDLVMGQRLTAIGTLVERHSRFVMLFPLPNGHTAEAVRTALGHAIARLPDQLWRRTAPSAGGLYPLEVYVVTADGVFHYDPAQHGLSMVAGEDLREPLSRVALDQEAVRDAPAVFGVTAVVARTASKYGDRATRYVHLEAGHAAQSLLLQAVALGLGGVPIGAFDDDGVQRVLGLTHGEEPVYLIPIGHPAE
jgi:SagB-type dehydrogenase family enzyme